ncbi:hypothetical protein PN462_12110 [Spirulina sp. CS-785/01]|uniref:hypothetical protein n=1 Tax=Spirulina sp. CS-785/01 TaxID=3021716 RepID=UPI00232D3B89|nr:hypothetical protein [Spirulina sp. CS-785/01]MDB9313847.1 hypothetical protein [Spirulina sp. CS-785/01]
MTQSTPPSINFNNLLESEKRRKEIATHIAEAHEEYKQGKTQKVTVDKLMADLEQ